jgi:hypothetical protein
MKEVVAYFKIFYKYLAEGAEERNEIPQSG